MHPHFVTRGHVMLLILLFNLKSLQKTLCRLETVPFHLINDKTRNLTKQNFLKSQFVNNNVFNDMKRIVLWYTSILNSIRITQNGVSHDFRHLNTLFLIL